MHYSHFFSPQEAHAHCDVPCGIYSAHPMLIAAQTVETMVSKMLELKMPDTKDEHALLAYHNTLTRMISTKEEHAQLCKEELLILWTDYFKPEHLAMFPDLHENFWKTAKLCSKNKQEVNPEAAKKLSGAVKSIADMFYKAQKAKHA